MRAASALGGLCGLALLVTARLSESDGPTKLRGRARAIAKTGALCSPALGESDAYPVVSGGGGGAEIRNAPIITVALGSGFCQVQRDRTVCFVLVAAADVMIAGRRYGRFVLEAGGWFILTTPPST